MPHMNFFVGGGSAPVGALALLIAWDRFDKGVALADEEMADLDGVGLYSWIGPTWGAQLVRARSKSLISLPEESCPTFPDGYPDADYTVRFELKKPSGGSIADLTFEVFNGSDRVYSGAPEGHTIKVELADNALVGADLVIQDRLTVAAWEDPLEGPAQFINRTDPAKEIWRSLMTPDLPVQWLL
jgi:hypothetical protein